MGRNSFDDTASFLEDLLFLDIILLSIIRNLGRGDGLV